jgi:hypothetical protein
MLAYLDTLIGFAVVMLGVSLLITILTQFFSALLSHRGVNLAWGLKTLFENIDPGLTTLKKEADSLSRKVLSHCLISDSWLSGWKGSFFQRFQLASAIRPAELRAILDQFAAADPTSGLSKDITTLLAKRNPAAAADLALVTAALDANPTVKQFVATAAQPLVQEAVDTVSKGAGDLEAWFGSMMDRVSQRFTMTMRVWTVVLAAAFALVTGLNSVELLQRLYGDSTLRAQLVSAAQPISDASVDVGNAVADANTGALRRALAASGIQPAEAPTGIASEDQGRKWIQSHVMTSAYRDKALAAFDAESEKATRDLIQSRVQAAANVNAILTKAGYEALALHYPPDFGKQERTAQAAYLLGVIVTIMLLSLGAPFWFNALKSLTNLRPVLAKQTGDRRDVTS